MSEKYSNTQRLHAVIGWLGKAHSITNKQGFSIGFDIRRGWLTSYSETTGYIIPTLYRYASLFDSSEVQDIATTAARWLISIQNEDGSIIDFAGHHKRSKTRPPVVFNTGQDLFGLLAAYRSTGEDIFLESAKKAAKWIIEKQEKGGLWNDTHSSGSRSMASYYSHVTWPLFLVGVELSDESIKEGANAGLNKILDLVNSNCSVNYWGFQADKPAFTHTIAYTIEGMLEQGILAEGVQARAFTMAKSIALKTIELLEKDRKSAGSYDENWRGDFSYVCMPGNCQLALIYLRLHTLSGENKYLQAADRVLPPVLKRQHMARLLPSAIKGTVPASWPPVAGKYMRWLYPNWGAKYLADALMFKIFVDDNGTFSHPNYFDLLDRFPG